LMRGLGKSRAQSRHDLLNAAWENLTSLDFVGDVANPSSFDRLCQVAGWNNASMRVNARPGIVRGTLGRARRGDLGYAYRASRIGSSRWSGIQEFASIFSQVNQADGDLLLRLNGSLGSGLID